MNRLVREHDPVSKLPEDLREGFEGRRDVTVTIEADPAVKPMSGHSDAPTRDSAAERSWIERGRQVRQQNFTSVEEIDAYVQSLRQ